MRRLPPPDHQRSLFDPPVCRFCGGETGPNHWLTCDGRQGAIEARIAESPPPDFDGETYVRPRDHDRLFAQLAKVQSAMADHGWHTLPELELTTGAPQASISARLRDLRKPKFGAYQVERRYVVAGLWEYRLLAPHPVERAG